jgi:predicted Rossmann fold nucleotide-binding protein DprA/Smf involved in DNA uptake
MLSGDLQAGGDHMAAITDPRVQFAIRRSIQKRIQRRNERQVLETLALYGPARVRDLVDLTGLEASECGKALDRLRILGRVEQEDGYFRALAEKEKKTWHQ